MNARPVYSVTQINTYIKGMLDSDRVLTGVFIRGEISNYKVYPSAPSAASCSGGRPPPSASGPRAA